MSKKMINFTHKIINHMVNIGFKLEKRPNEFLITFVDVK